METINLISARLEEGLSIKTCNQCKAEDRIYETSSVKDMLDHLEECGRVLKE